MDGIFYTYDPATGEYRAPVVGQPSPLEPGKFWEPAHSTAVEPPITETPDQVAVYADGFWALEPDFRGKILYNKADATAHGVQVGTIGSIPDGWTLSKPPALVDGFAAVFGDTDWALQPDFRNQTIFDQSSDASKVVTEIGPIPAGWSLTPPPVLMDFRTAKLIEINRHCTMLLDAMKAGYPNDEVQSWIKQETEARAYVVNNSAPTPLLSALATARGVSLADAVANVIQKADLFTVASGQIIGTRQKYKDLINAAPDIAAVNAITWT